MSLYVTVILLSLARETDTVKVVKSPDPPSQRLPMVQLEDPLFLHRLLLLVVMSWLRCKGLHRNTVNKVLVLSTTLLPVGPSALH